MATLSEAGPRGGATMRAVVTASFAGALLEWYDFFLYGTASALVLNKLFFPDLGSATGTMASLATFGAGFVARPVGGLIFGHFGDRSGRKSMLIATALIMGGGTFLIGLLPSYGTIGVWAPILLVVLRLAQGIGLGGEYAGAALLTIEHAPRARRGFWGSIPQAAASAGILLGTSVFSLVSLLPSQQFLAWGWRIPFLVSVVLLAVGLLIRSRVAETPEFEQATRRHEQRAAGRARIPLVELLRRHPRNLGLAFGARLAETVSSNIFNAFAIVYIGTTLAMSKSSALNGILIGSAIGIVACPLFGLLADRIGKRTVYLLGAGFTVAFAFPFFLLLNTQSPAMVWLAVVIGYVFGPTMMFAAQATFFAELFGANTRYTGLSLAYQLSAIAGGFTPAVAAALLAAGANTPWLVGGFLAAVALLSGMSAYAATATRTGNGALTTPPR